MDHDTSMDEEPRRRKKNFLSGLFRRRSDAPKGERNGKLVRMSLAFFSCFFFSSFFLLWRK